VELKIGVTLPFAAGDHTDGRRAGSDKNARTRASSARTGRRSPCSSNAETTAVLRLTTLRVSLVLPAGLQFPSVENADQLYTKLDGKQEVVFSWKVIATGDKTGKMDLKFIITSDSTEDKVVSKSVEVDPLPVSISWNGVPEETNANLFFTAGAFRHQHQVAWKRRA